MCMWQGKNALFKPLHSTPLLSFEVTDDTILEARSQVIFLMFTLKLNLIIGFDAILHTKLRDSGINLAGILDTLMDYGLEEEKERNGWIVSEKTEHYVAMKLSLNRSYLSSWRSTLLEGNCMTLGLPVHKDIVVISEALSQVSMSTCQGCVVLCWAAVTRCVVDGWLSHIRNCIQCTVYSLLVHLAKTSSPIQLRLWYWVAI